jgi:nucleoside-triphosphatase
VRGARGDFRDVKHKVLLTGRPGCGKTTLVKRVANNLRQSAGGFYTEEIRDSESVRERGRGQRVGFKIVTLDGKEAIFAHVSFKASERIGKYGLDLTRLETVGVTAVREAVRKRQLVVIDEIGPMEIRSAIFRSAVNDAFDSGVSILGTVVARSLPFTDSIKKRSDVTVIELRPDNRKQLFAEMLGRFNT